MEIARKIFVKTFFFFFWRALALVSLVLGLGLEHSCWSRECLSSERLSLALASDFFCVLGLEPCVLNSTSGGNSTFPLQLAENLQFCFDLVTICTYVERIGRTYILFKKILGKSCDLYASIYGSLFVSFVFVCLQEQKMSVKAAVLKGALLKASKYGVNLLYFCSLLAMHYKTVINSNIPENEIEKLYISAQNCFTF